MAADMLSPHASRFRLYPVAPRYAGLVLLCAADGVMLARKLRARLRRALRSRACDVDLSDEAQWRDDIASLAFPVRGHGAICAVHRGAFRTLIGAEPTPEDCLGYFRRYETAFREAARAKIARKGISLGTSLHLTSRDVARKLIEDHQIAHGEPS